MSNNVMKRREEQIQYNFATLILAHAEVDFERVAAAGKRHLPQVRSRVRGAYYTQMMDDWERALGDFESLRALLLRTDEYGIDARQVCPILGILSREERWEAILDASGKTLEDYPLPPVWDLDDLR